MSADLRIGALKQRYWDWCQTKDHVLALRHLPNKGFISVLTADAIGAMTGAIQPVSGQAGTKAHAAAAWLLRAQAVTLDDGVSLGYFPCSPRTTLGWLPSYPETTGYIIQSLLEYACRYDQPDILERVRAMGHWEAQVQMASGAVQAGPVCPPAKQSPAVFNTGMVLQGWTALLAEGSDPIIQEAARKAADFIVADQAEDGHFRTHGPSVAHARIKTYNCLCAWALLRFARISGESQYAASAIRAAEAAVREQNEAGWFAYNCLTQPEAPLTHTIGYTLQGLLETGLLAGREDIVATARRGIDAVLSKVARNGYLSARFDNEWRSVGSSSCLTGNAQIAIVAYRFYQVTGEESYRAAADRLVDFLKALQRNDSGDENLKGALGGSFPIHGSYMTWGYPNWATKYLLDSLMLQEECERK